jgi:hypothetical protein
MMRRLLTYPLFALAIGCYAEPASQAPTDSSVVFNSHASLTAAAALAATPDLQVGPPALALAEITDVSVDSAGNIFVLDARDRAVWRLAPDGSVLNRIGQQGEGPGEFQAPRRLAVWRDTIAVFEIRRFHVFEHSGKLVRSLAYDAPSAAQAERAQGSGFLLIDHARETSDGVYVVIDRIPDGLDIGPYRDTLVLQKFDLRTGLRGERITSVLTSPVFLLGGRYLRKPLGAAQEQIAVGGDGRAYVSAGDSYHIAVLGRDGARQRSYTGEVRQQPITDEELRAAVDRELADFIREHTPPTPSDTAVISVLRTEAIRAGRADARPVLGRLFVSGPGTLLVERLDLDKELRNPWVTPSVVTDSDFPDPVMTRDSTRWDVLDSTGKISGRVTLPPNVDVLLFTGEHLYGVKRDSLRVPSLVRYRLSS